MHFNLVQSIPMLAVFIVICVLPLLIIMNVANNKYKRRVKELEQEIKILRGRNE